MPGKTVVRHGKHLAANMTGHAAIGCEAKGLRVMSKPSRGYWRGDTPAEFSLSTPYVYDNDPANKGGVVPAGGMTIDGFVIPAGTVVVQFCDFSAGDFYLTGSTSFMWRGCRFRGRSSAPGYFNCQAGHTGKLYFFYNDLGGLGSAPDQFNEVPIKVANASRVIAYRNRVQFTTTGFQCNIGGAVRIVENFISDLTTFGTDAHLNGITFNGGENNVQVLRNNIAIQTPDTSGRPVNQTDCVSFFQDFGDFSVDTMKRVLGNYLGGTGYCIYAGLNAGKPTSSVQYMEVLNNLFTTQHYPRGGSFGPISAEPMWGVDGNVATGNCWADGPNAKQLAFGK